MTVTRPPRRADPADLTLAVSMGLPSPPPEAWRADIKRARAKLGAEQLLIVSVAGTATPGGDGEQLAQDYALCARWAAEAGADVVELHRRAAAVDDRISLSTVYRTVKLLETEGIIERLELRDGRARYERAPRQHHDHLIDLATGGVIEFRSEEIEALQTEIAKRLGYRVVYHRLELYAVPLDEDGPA